MRPAAIVTGASRGIGRGIALSLATAGYDLVVNYARNAAAAQEVAEAVAERGGKAPMHLGSRGARKAPGIGHLLAKPFESASKWMGKSGRAGRRGRNKMPL